jgi:hypothetical protein
MSETALAGHSGNPVRSPWMIRSCRRAWFPDCSRKTHILEHSAGSSLLVVRFTEIGAPPIPHQPADELYSHTSALDALLPQCEVVS